MATSNALTDYSENLIVNALLRHQSISKPHVYFALFKANPGEGGTKSQEVSGGAYTRMEATFTAPANGITKNATEVTFPTATGDWGNITHVGIADSQTPGSGNILVYCAANNTRSVLAGDSVSIRQNEFTFQLS